MTSKSASPSAYAAPEIDKVNQRIKMVNLAKKLVTLLIIIIVLVALFYGGSKLLPVLFKQTATLSETGENPTIFRQTIAEVKVSGDGFYPATLLIKKGSSVKWINQDRGSHQIASDPHPLHSQLPGLVSSKLLDNGAFFTYTFNRTGTFTYHDEYGPLKSKGTIIVE